MKNYIKQFFSWKGIAGRKEMIGVCLLWVFASPAVGIFFLFGDMFFKFLYGTTSPRSLHDLIFCIVFLFTLAMLICSSARRLRHIGWSTLLAFLPLAMYIPVVGFFIAAIFLILLCVIPAKKDAQPPLPLPKSYFKLNLSIVVFLFVIPLVVLFLLSGVVKYAPKTLTVFPGIQQTLQKKEQQRESIHQEKKEEDPMAVSLHVPAPPASAGHVIRYEGQTKPAFGREFWVSDPHSHPSVKRSVWKWDLPDTTTLADTTTWDLRQKHSCGSMCKYVPSMDRQKTLHVVWIPEAKGWTQMVMQRGELVETVLFDANKTWLEFRRIKNKKPVQIYAKTKTNAIRFFDIGIQKHPYYARSFSGVEDYIVWLFIEPNSSFKPIAFSIANPQQRTISPREQFNAPWPGIQISTKWIEYLS